MDFLDDQTHSMLVESEPSTKRRKLRKGTVSCWECKRRKLRCTFSTDLGPACDGCRRRGSACISQDFPDEPAQPSSGQTHDRLDSIEIILKQLANKVNEISSALHSIQRDTTTLRSTSNFTIASTDPYYGLCQALIAAWPSQQDLELILSVPAPQACLSLDTHSLPSEILQLPPSGSHPVLIAKKLLLLGVYMQDLSPYLAQQLVGLSTSHEHIMICVVETATRLVTSQDELVSSIEGIECIMLETRYHDYSGNFRRAWLATRRAMNVGQLIGIHRNAHSPSFKTLEVDTQTRVDTSQMWFRIVQTDRYLSLILGLPLGYLNNNFATPSALERCSPLERMQRIECVATTRILQRNDAETHDIARTRETDTLLQKASAIMPAQWWLTPTIDYSADEEANYINRIMNQFAYYHVLAQLHLPYVLRFSAHPQYDYSKITAITASREVLSRFISFSGIMKSSSYCRSVDLLAFIACAALCLAHIDVHCQRRKTSTSTHAQFNTTLDLLMHQRLKDRNMMDRTLERFEDMSYNSMGVVSSKTVRILQSLLVIEADAARGSGYSTSVLANSKREEFECGGETSEAGDVLHIHIPHFGIVKVERTGPRTQQNLLESPTPMSLNELSPPKALRLEAMIAPHTSLLPEQRDKTARQLSDTTFQPEETQIQDTFLQPSTSQIVAKFNDKGDSYDAQSLVSELLAELDGWDKQDSGLDFMDDLATETFTTDTAGESSFDMEPGVPSSLG